MGLASNSGSVRNAGWVAVLCMSASLLAGTAQAARLQVVVNGQGVPAADAVVSLHSPAALAATRAGRGTIDQRNTQFVPRVSVVTIGTPVSFPNSDNVRHQVYSFSPAKRFELPLYSGKPAAPVVFDAPGVVELGCNIHDWMLAYVVVVDTPYFAIVDARGRIDIEAPAGTYTLRVWHPGLKGGKPHEETVMIGTAPVDRTVSLSLVAAPEAPAPADEKLRALQEKFRKLKDKQ
jgi:plastocyanin